MDTNPNVQIKSLEKQGFKSNKKKRVDVTEDHTHSFSIQPRKEFKNKIQRPQVKKNSTAYMFENNALT